jgi:hypothetical protein
MSRLSLFAIATLAALSGCQRESSDTHKVTEQSSSVISSVYVSCQKDNLCNSLKLARTAQKPYRLSGSLTMPKLVNGKSFSKEIQIIDYRITADGVPVGITFPSSSLGQPDKEFSLFFFGNRLELVGPGCNPRCIMQASDSQ